MHQPVQRISTFRFVMEVLRSVAAFVAAGASVATLLLHLSRG